MMITEDYVSFETAKLLKEKGFDEECNSAYCFIHRSPEDKGEWDIYYNPMLFSETSIMRPTLNVAMKWLREIHNLFIEIDRYYFVVDRLSHIVSGFKYSIKIKRINTEYTADFDSYEQACDVAIKYCLENLI